VVLERLEIGARFCGPPEVGNGGYVAGRLARHLPGSCEVALRAPAPLEQPLEIRRGDEGSVELFDGDTLIARARPSRLQLEAPGPPSFAEASERAGSCRALQTHPFPRCFVCGPDRAPGDGLRILPGWLPRRQQAAAVFVPGEDLAGDDGRVDPVFVWSALDSPSSFPLLEPPESRRLEPMVLGRLAVDVREPPRAGERCLVSAWTIGLEGRRGFAGAALWSERGALLAAGRATWVSLA
jgi:hypothetical protein